MEDNAWLMQFAELDPWVGYCVLAAASIIEYIFSPFPGDTIVLLGAVLSQTAGWSLSIVLVCVVGGNMLGALLNYEVGVWLDRSDKETWLHRKIRSPAIQPGIARIQNNFQRYGAGYICVNRFLPGVRSFFFLAAGMAHLPRSKVMVYGGVSSLAWGLLIVGVGHLIGFQLDRLIAVFRGYTQVAWIVLVLVAVGLGVRWWLKRRKTNSDDPDAR